MSAFDEAWEGSVEAEINEMGVWGSIRSDVHATDDLEVKGVKTDVERSHRHAAGGKRDVVRFSFFISKDDADGVEKGFVVKVGGEKGRVLNIEDLDGGGVELQCGPVKSWSGAVPGG